MPCPYANALGVPREGFHAQRWNGYAINDILGTLALAGMTSYAAKISFVRSSIIWFTAAEILHYAFGVRSQFLETFNLLPPCALEEEASPPHTMPLHPEHHSKPNSHP